jgi:hypothetical protein
MRARVHFTASLIYRAELGSSASQDSQQQLKCLEMWVVSEVSAVIDGKPAMVS